MVKKTKFILNLQNKISDFCATPVGVGAVEKCLTKTPPNQITHLNIIFHRPDPDPFFGTNLAESYTQARIVIESPQGITREIEVLQTGQVSVKRN